MLIVCPSCASEYSIDPERVGANGRKVRCAACRTEWFVEAATDALTDSPAEPPLSVAAETARVPAVPKRKRSPAPKRKVKLRLAWPGRAAAAALAALAVVASISAALAARVPIVRALPQAARLYAAMGLPVNLRGLDFREVRSSLVRAGADTFLVVEGEIANATATERPVPALELVVRGAAGDTLYTWTNEAPRPTLETTGTVRFRARLASPPPEGRQVLVRFAAAGAPAAPRSDRIDP